MCEVPNMYRFKEFFFEHLVAVVVLAAVFMQLLSRRSYLYSANFFYSRFGVVTLSLIVMVQGWTIIS